PTLTDESAIDDIHVFVFESGTDLLDHWTQAYITSSTATGTTGTVVLDPVTNSAAQHKLVFLANVEAEILSSASQISAGMTYAAFESLLKTNINSILTTEPDNSFRFPMWGESAPVTIDNALDLTGSNAITMQRSLSKIDVAVNLQSDGTAAGLTELKVTGVTLYGVNEEALVIPASANRTSGGYVTAPTVSGTAKVDVERTVADGRHGSLSSIYAPETYNNTTTVYADRPYVIVKGIFLGDDPANTTETYYRLDLVTGQDKDSPVDLMRNYSYTLNITAVRSAGYDSADDAKAYPPAGLSYDFFPSTAGTYYRYFCYSDVGYLATTTDYVKITNHLAGSTATQTYKAEYMGNTAPELAVAICDASGKETTSSHFTVSISSSTVTARALLVNDTYYPKIEYMKVYLVDDPNICLNSELQHSVFSLESVTVRGVCYDRTSSASGVTSPNEVATSSYPHLPNNDQYFAIRWSAISMTLPASKFRITRGSTSVEVAHPAGTAGASDNFLMPPHTSNNYVGWYIEWWNEYENFGAGDWVEFATVFEQVGTNLRLRTDSNYYMAVNDLEYGAGGKFEPGSGVYTGWTWAEAMGLDLSYNSITFSSLPELSSGGYTPTEETGCGDYWEGSETHPVTGRGKWQLPRSTLISLPAMNTYYFTPGNYRGIDAGNFEISTSANYLTATNSIGNFTGNRLGSASVTNNISKTTRAIDFRVRCIRRIEDE
ncbi:MAG: fimbrial protein, partial [Alistipes sp.]|nr:fimbrial protein [Alistipes sp.]